MTMIKYIIGEIAVVLFLVIGVDYLPHIIAWLPCIIYNYFFINKFVDRFTKFLDGGK